MDDNIGEFNETFGVVFSSLPPNINIGTFPFSAIVITDGKDLSQIVYITLNACDVLLHTQMMKDLLWSVFRLQWVPVDQFKSHVYP